MLNGEATVIRFEISFGHIGLMLGPVWQALPDTKDGVWVAADGVWVAADGPRLRTMPRFPESACRHDDYTSVVEESVLHHVTD